MQVLPPSIALHVRGMRQGVGAPLLSVDDELLLLCGRYIQQLGHVVLVKLGRTLGLIGAEAAGGVDRRTLAVTLPPGGHGKVSPHRDRLWAG